MATYSIKRGATVVASVKARGTQSRGIMVEDRVVMEFNLPNAVTFLKGDTVDVFGVTYKINQTTSVKRSREVNGYSYSIEFEALYYDLGKWYLNTLDQSNNLTQKQVYIMSDAATILQLVVDNANNNDSGWSLGEVDPTDVMQHTYSSAKLQNVLQDLADKYDNEFWFSGANGKTINFSMKQSSSGISLTYGAGNGLFEISRTKSDKPYYNKLTIQGGSTNIPADYGFKNIQLPAAFRPYLSANTNGFDIVEHDLVLENVFPKRVGGVTSLGGSLEVFDSSLDFDINDRLTAAAAKIAFISGQLAGFTFTISAYDHSTKKISFALIEDDPAYPLGVPNAYLKPGVGDKYVLLDIEMPQTYLDAAEAKLLAVGQDLLADASSENYTYGISLTPKWVLDNNPQIVLGNSIHIHYTPLSIDENLRILGYDRDLQEPYRYGLEVGLVAKISTLVKEATAQTTINNAVTSSGISAQNKPGNDTLDIVAKRGKTTSQILEPRGVVVSDLFAPPSVNPSVSEMSVNKWYMTIREAVPPAGSPPVVITKFTDLVDVDPTGRMQDYVVYWDTATGMHRYKAASFAPSGDVYTKTEIQNFFSGAVGITGYNKGNWDAAFSQSHTHTNKAFLDVINQNLSKSSSPEFIGATFYGSVFTENLHVETFLNVQGSAAIGAGMSVDNGLTVSTGTGGLFFKDYLSSSYHIELVMPPSFFGNNTIALPSTSGQLALVSQIPTNVVFNDGGTYNINISGSAAKWGGLEYYSTVPQDGNINSMLGVEEVNGVAYRMTKTAVSNWLGSVTSLPNSIVRRDANGYLVQNYIEYTGGAGDGAVTGIMAKTNVGGNYIYTQNATSVKSFLNLSDGSTLNNNISGSAALLNGYASSVSANGDTIVRRDNGGIINATYFNMSAPTVDAIGIADFVTTANDGYLRRSSSGAVRAALGLTSGVYDLQWVTDNGNSTTRAIHALGGLTTGNGPTFASSTLRGLLSYGSEEIFVGSWSNHPLCIYVNTFERARFTDTEATFYTNIEVQGDGIFSNTVSALSLEVQNDVLMTNYGAGLTGQYSATRYQSVFSMGAAYRPALDGTSLANHYGIAWTHEYAGGQSKAGLGHQMLITEAGVTQTAIGNGIWTRANISAAGKITAPIVQATAMLVVPKVDPVIADMPVGEWVLRIREVV